MASQEGAADVSAMLVRVAVSATSVAGWQMDMDTHPTLTLKRRIRLEHKWVLDLLRKLTPPAP